MFVAARQFLAGVRPSNPTPRTSILCARLPDPGQPPPVVQFSSTLALDRPNRAHRPFVPLRCRREWSSLVSSWTNCRWWPTGSLAFVGAVDPRRRQSYPFCGVKTVESEVRTRRRCARFSGQDRIACEQTAETADVYRKIQSGCGEIHTLEHRVRATVIAQHSMLSPLPYSNSALC